MIFFNKYGYLSEGAISNIFLIKQGRWYTPPLSAGILNGICRQNVLEKKNVTIKNLNKKDLLNADEIILTNSVAGIVRNTYLYKKR